MSMVNVSLVGNLVRAPEQICFASGRVKTVLVIAVNSQSHKSADKPSEPLADFYRIETWGKLAELAQKYLNKGNQVGVSGRLIMEHWTDKQGRERLTPVVSATQLSFPPRNNRESDSASAENSASKTDYEDDDLFAGARAVTVAEAPAHYYRSRLKSASARR
ncbi:MAG: single-stranded DNA-binding protein [Candidatus Obscuribacterales bacterium]|nr:single-stranded DNA-binding protein [Candidatus Obscuribacterales bacterium]